MVFLAIDRLNAGQQPDILAQIRVLGRVGGSDDLKLFTLKGQCDDAFAHPPGGSVYDQCWFHAQILIFYADCD
jgi:hypothetical protein